jgi:hypothetical protein
MRFGKMQKQPKQRPQTTTPTPPPPTGLTRALLVGINYVSTPYALAGCINDVSDMEKNLRSLYPSCKDYLTITDNTGIKPTKANILAGLFWLTMGLKPGQNVFFHYSGHGGRVRDRNGDEVSGLDSCIYPIRNGVLETITDDEIRAAIADKIPAGCKCFVVLDACHSGTAVDLRYGWQTPSQETLTYTENSRYAKTAGSVVFLSGCADEQVAADTATPQGRPCGALTMALLETWKSYGTAIKAKYLLWDVRKFLRERRYAQTPQLSTGTAMDMNQVFDMGV